MYYMQGPRDDSRALLKKSLLGNNWIIRNKILLRISLWLIELLIFQIFIIYFSFFDKLHTHHLLINNN